MILGRNFLKSHRSRIDHAKDIVQIGDARIFINTVDNSVTHVASINTDLISSTQRQIISELSQLQAAIDTSSVSSSTVPTTTHSLSTDTNSSIGVVTITASEAPIISQNALSANSFFYEFLKVFLCFIQVLVLTLGSTIQHVHNNIDLHQSYTHSSIVATCNYKYAC